MRAILKDAIQRIYFDGDYEYFIRKMNAPWNLDENFVELLAEYKVDLEYYQRDISSTFPSIHFSIDFPKIYQGEFNIQYSVDLTLSKIVSVFYFLPSFMFEIANRKSWREHRTFETLANSDVVYCKEQAEFQEKIRNYLLARGYTEIYYSEIDEIVAELKMPDEVYLFGDQVRVDCLLFNDIYDLENGGKHEGWSGKKRPIVSKVHHKVIQKIYFQKKYDYLFKKLKNKFIPDYEFFKILEANVKSCEKNELPQTSLSDQWLLNDDIYINGELVKIRATIYVCKLVKAWSMDGYFEMRNQDENGLVKILSDNDMFGCSLGFSGVYDEVRKYFSKKGYKRINIKEVIGGLEVPAEKQHLGKQVTVKMLLIDDIYDLAKKQK